MIFDVCHAINENAMGAKKRKVYNNGFRTCGEIRICTLSELLNGMAEVPAGSIDNELISTTLYVSFMLWLVKKAYIDF